MKEIIVKYLEGTASDAEKRELLEWLRKKGNRKDFDFHSFAWKNGLNKDSFPSGGEETWQKIQSGLFKKNYSGWQKSRKVEQFLRYAAVFFFITTVGSLLWVFVNRPNASVERVTRIIADNGQISKVLLPDSSVVWLNSGSSLTYSNSFAENNRDLRLIGEAYFEVAKNKKLPLVVNCNSLLIKVTGTKFDVNSYPSKDKISIILEEGSVQLLSKNNASFQSTLQPGELAVFDLSNKKLAISKINTYKYTAWKEGIIHVYNQTLAEVTERLKTRYNQEFKISADVKPYHYTFTIKNEPLQEIISLIEKITPVKAEQNGTVITFKPDYKRIKKINN
jgi:transmembrane sensor